MALAVANIAQVEGLSGNVRLVTAQVTLDTSYPTGGSPGLAGLLGLNSILALLDTVANGYGIDYIPASDLLKVYRMPAAATLGPLVEVANATNLSAVVCQAMAFGRPG